MTWVREVHPEAMPYKRVRVTNEELPKPVARREPTGTLAQQGLFSGSAEAEARRETFTKPIDVVDEQELDDSDR